MTAAADLAQAAAATEWRDLPANVRDQAADLMLDTLAVIAAGGTDQAHDRFARANTAAAGPCTVIGHGNTTGAAAAALVNGAATTVLQLQDGHRLARGHPASHIVPAVLAMAEETGTTADAVVNGFVAAYEVAARVGIALGGLRPDIHDAGTWGTVGAGVGAAMMVSRDPAVLAEIIEGCATIAMLPWLQTAPRGAGMHHLYIGMGASAGVTVAQAAIAGWHALPHAVETFFGPRAGAKFDAGRLTAGIAGGRWTTFELMNAYLKVYPTCAHLHGANDAVTQLIADHGIRASDVSGVDIATYSHAMAYDNDTPENALAARFSARYTTAIALHAGGLGYGAITEASLHDPDVVSLAARIHVRHDPDLDQFYPAGRPARVTLQLKDGRELSALCKFPRGDHTNPTTRAERRDKARTLLAWRFGATGAKRIIDEFDGMIGGGALAPLMAALRK